MYQKLHARWLIRELYKRPRSPYYWGHVRDERHERVHRFSTKETRKKFATQAVLDWIEERERREELVVRSSVPVLADAFNEWIDAKSVRDVTRTDYHSDLNNVYAPRFGGRLVNEVTFADAQKFLTAYRDRSARTRQKHVRALRSFFGWAQQMRYCDENPFDDVRVKQATPKRDHVLSDKEARSLLRTCRAEFTTKKKDRRRPKGWKETRTPPKGLYLAVVIGLYTGLRKTNLFALRWEQVDLVARQINIPGEEMKAGNPHSVPLHPNVAPLLKGNRVGAKDSDLVVSPTVNTKAYQRAQKRADIPHVTWRSLRRTFASWLQSQCSYACLKSLMAHAIDEDVTGKYIHVTWDEKVAAIGKLPDLLANSGVRRRR